MTRSATPFVLRLLGLILVAYLLALLSLRIFPLQFDEGVNLLAAHFMGAGYQPYTQVVVSRFPLFLGILSTIWNITTGDMILTKTIWIALNTLSLALLGYLGRKLLDEKVALLAVFLLALSTSYLSISASITPGLLSTLFGSLSILLTLAYLEKTNRAWLLVAGCTLAIGILIELLAFHMLLVLILLLLSRNSPEAMRESVSSRLTASWKSFILDVFLLLAGASFILAVFSLLFGSETVYNSTINYRLALRETLPFNIRDNMRGLLQFINENGFLFVGMLLGLVFAQNDTRHVVWFVFTWWMMAAFWLMVQVPFQAVQVVTLWAPMALVASWGFYKLSNWLVQAPLARWERLGRARIQAAHVLSLILVFYAIWNYCQIPGLLNRMQNIRDEEDLREVQAVPQAAAFLQSVSSADDCAISDDPVFSVQAQRFPPPALVEPSSERIAGSFMSLRSIESAALEYHCPALIVTSHGFRESIPDIASWAAAFYPQSVNLEGIRIYYRLP